MANTFEAKFMLCKKWSNLIVLPLSLVLLLVALIFGGAWMYILALLLLLGVLMMNSLWFVPTGYAGIKTRFTKLVNASYKEGINFLIPVIEQGLLMVTRVITKIVTDVKKVLTRNNVTLEYTITFQIDPQYADMIYRFWGVDYYDTHVAKWVDAAFDTFVSQITYPQLQSQKDRVEEIASALILQEVDRKCSEASVGYGSHDAYRCDFSADITAAVDLDEDGVTEEVPQLKLRTWTEKNVPGLMFFKSFSIKINKVTFEADYEAARAKVAVAKANVSKAEQEKKAALILAETKKQAEILAADAKAEAIRRTGKAEAEKIEMVRKAENEAEKVLGEYMMKNPLILKKFLTQNFPKVFGGASPIINIDEMLGTKPPIM